VAPVQPPRHSVAAPVRPQPPAASLPSSFVAMYCCVHVATAELPSATHLCVLGVLLLGVLGWGHVGAGWQAAAVIA
jgi:hypothetical protein